VAEHSEALPAMGIATHQNENLRGGSCILSAKPVELD